MESISCKRFLRLRYLQLGQILRASKRVYHSLTEQNACTSVTLFILARGGISINIYLSNSQLTQRPNNLISTFFSDCSFKKPTIPYCSKFSSLMQAHSTTHFP